MPDLPSLTPKSEVIKMAAQKAGVTQTEMEKCYNALRDTYKSIANLKDFQRFSVLDLVTAEERQVSGTTPTDLGSGGGKKYNSHAFSFRQSDELSEAANKSQGKK